MPRARSTLLVALLITGGAATGLAAQDSTSSTGQALPDTSAYTGAGGVDTTPWPQRVGVPDSAGAGAGAGSSDTTPWPQRVGPPNSAGAAAMDTLGGGAADTAGLTRSMGDSGVGDRIARDSTAGDSAVVDSILGYGSVGDTSGSSTGVYAPRDTMSSDASEDGRPASDTSGVAQPGRQPSQNTSPSGAVGDSTR